MNRGLFRGLGPASFLPPWAGGNDPSNDGKVLVADSSAPGAARIGNPSAHGCIAYNSASYTCAEGTATAFACNTNQWDSDGYHSVTTNTNRITIPAGLGGIYVISAFAEPVVSGGTRTFQEIAELYVSLNGGRRPLDIYSYVGQGVGRLVGSTTWSLNPGDALDFFIFFVTQATTRTVNSDITLLWPTVGCELAGV